MKFWIARDSYGLWLFTNKPTKIIINGERIVFLNGNTRYHIDSKLFLKVTLENSPQEVELKLIEK